MRLSKILMGSLPVAAAITRVFTLIVLTISPVAGASLASLQNNLSGHPAGIVSTISPISGTIPATQVRLGRAIAQQSTDSRSEEDSRIKLNTGLAKKAVKGNGPVPGSGSKPPGPTVVSPAAASNFEGLHPTVVCTVPPDSDGAVGPTYYVAFVNNLGDCSTQTPSGNVGFFSKINGTLIAAFYYSQLFTGFSSNCNDSTTYADPQVIYDSATDRYLFVLFTATAPYHMCIAASLSNDPINGSYCAASYSTVTGSIPDYDKAGVWIDGFYVSYNPSPSDSRTVVFNKSDLESCNIIRDQDFDMGSDSREHDNFCTPQPNHIFRPVPATYSIFTGGSPANGEPEFLVSTYCLSGHVYVFTLHVNWSMPTGSTLSSALISVQTTHFAPGSVSSPGNPLDTLNLILMTPANYVKDSSGNEYLWTTMTVCNGTSCTASTGTSAIAWYQLKVLNGNPSGTTVQNQGIWAPDSTSRLQAAGAFDRQINALVEYTQVSSSQDPAVAYAGRLASDPANTLNQTETVLFRGPSMATGACSTQNPCHRWGDYGSNFIDVDGCTFWFTHEYYATTNPWLWDTRIGAVRYPSCTPLTYSKTIAPSLLTFTSLGIGVTTPSKTITVTNTGTGPLVVQPSNITGTNAADFVVASNNCSTAVAGVQAGAGCNLQVTCTPSGSGTRTASLNIMTNTAAADSTRIALSCGSGLATSTSLSCLPAMVAIRQETVCTVTVADVPPGTLTPSGNVSFTSSVTTSSFTAVSCVLTGTNSSAECVVSYSQTGTITSPTIMASYVGDTGHMTSTGTTGLTVFLTGDVNGDCKVDIVDLAKVGAAFGSTPSSPSWNPAADLDHNGKIDIVDLVIVASRFGSVC